MLPNVLPSIILASSSPARRGLMGRLQMPFDCFSPDVDETPLTDETPQQLVKRLAVMKAKVGEARYPNSLIIGCDQVGVLNNEILCKPITHERAIEQLEKVSGKMVRFLTGMCVYDTRTLQLQESTAVYDVYFRTLTRNDIETYLYKEKPYQCAGSFQAEGLGITLIEKLAGDDYTALIGLSLIQLVTMLRVAASEVKT